MRGRGAARRAEVAGEQRARSGAGSPAERRAGDRDDHDLRAGDEPRLAAARPEPAQPAPERTMVAAEAGRGEDGEPEQQHRGVAADEQQPARGDAARRLDAGERVRRRGEAEQIGGRLGAVRGEVEAALQRRDLPRVHGARRERDDPAVRARDESGVGQRHAREAGDTVREQDGRAVAPGRAEVGGERRPGPQDGPPDDVEVRQLRRHGCAADLDELAVRGRARSGQAAATERDPAREPVGGAEVDVGAAPGGLPEDGDADRRLAGDDAERAARGAIELRERELGLAGHPAPVHLHGTVGGAEAGERPLDGAILHGDRGDRCHREHGGADGDARGGERAAAGVGAEAGESEAQRHEQRRHRCSFARAATAAQPPTGKRWCR